MFVCVCMSAFRGYIATYTYTHILYNYILYSDIYNYIL